LYIFHWGFHTTRRFGLFEHLLSNKCTRTHPRAAVWCVISKEPRQLFA